MEKPWQDVEKVRQLCSRGPSRLDVPNRVTAPRRVSSLAAAALGSLFDHPAGCCDAVPDLIECWVATVPQGFFKNLLALHWVSVVD